MGKSHKWQVSVITRLMAVFRYCCETQVSVSGHGAGVGAGSHVGAGRAIAPARRSRPGMGLFGGL